MAHYLWRSEAAVAIKSMRCGGAGPWHGLDVSERWVNVNANMNALQGRVASNMARRKQVQSYATR